jgi:hypothetical protein
MSRLEPIRYNEGEGKEGPFFFIFLGKSINNQILFSLLVNDLVIIAKYLGDPFFFSPRMKLFVLENT